MNCNAAYCESSLAQRAAPAPAGAAKALGIPLLLDPLVPPRRRNSNP
jgi:hypothetical protein